jgi:hypothetical protein
MATILRNARSSDAGSIFPLSGSLFEDSRGYLPRETSASMNSKSMLQIIVSENSMVQ